MALYKYHYIELDTKRSPRISLQNIVAGETGNRIWITVTNNGETIDMSEKDDGEYIYRVSLRIDSDLGTRRQDSDDPDGGITFVEENTGDHGKINILLSADSFTAGKNRCRLEIYSKRSEDDDTLICSAEWTFDAAGNPTGENTGTVYPLMVYYEQLAKSWAVGGTGRRDGEDADNSKFYSEMAQDAVEQKVVSPSITAWMDANESFTQPIIEDKVDAWLDDHPEATTTVEDRSLDASKLTIALSTELKKGSVEKTNNFTGWQQGQINNSGGSSSSDYKCRTGTVTFDSTWISTITPKSGYKMTCNVYNGTPSAGTFVERLFENETDPYVMSVDTSLTYRFMVGKTDDSELPLADLPADVLTYTTYAPTDVTLVTANKAADAKATGDAIRDVFAYNLNGKTKVSATLTGWTQGTIKPATGSGGSSSETCRIVTAMTFVNSGIIQFKPKTGYKLCVFQYSSAGVYEGLLFDYTADNKWAYVSDQKQYKYTVQLVAGGNLAVADLPADVVSYDIYYDYAAQLTKDVSALSTHVYHNEDNCSVLTNVLRAAPFYDHLFSDKMNGNNVVIPAESVFALQISRRLGFKVTEINLNETSDGDYVVLHGSSGTFGAQVEHVDGVTDISSTAINTVSMSWIKSNVRFKSLYAKYRTAPSSLSEYLIECKKNGLIPMIQFRTDNSYVIANEIMGTDNYIAYNGSRSKTAAPIMYAKGTSPSTTADILAFCDQYGKPFWYCMTQPGSFTDEQLTDIIETLHANGYQIGFAGNYTTEAEAQRCFDLGFDFSSSNHQVNDTVFGNLCNINGDLTYTDFDTDGTVSNGVLSLSENDTIEPSETISSVFLGCGVLNIRFSGKLRVQMGSYIDAEITSDGSSVKVFSTYFLNAAPTFTLTAKTSTSVYSIEYRADRR